MASKTTKFLTQSITGVLILGIVSTFLSDWLKSLSFLTTLKSILLWLWNGFIWLLNFEVKVWWLLIGTVIIVIIVSLIASKSNTEATAPTFLQYKKDTFEKWVWKWEWHFNGSRYEVDNLHPCCPVCETPLIRQSSGYNAASSLECPRGHQMERRGFDTYTENINKIEVLLLDNVHKGNFKVVE